MTTSPQPARIAIVGGGPAALMMAIALARRGLPSAVFERDAHPDVAPRFNPDRSYTIDITGHGARALRYIDAATQFDHDLIQFKGVKLLSHKTEEWTEQGWTGSRGDILRSLMVVISARHRDLIDFHFSTRVDAVDVTEGRLTYTSADGATQTSPFDLIVGGDGAGSVVRKAMLEQVPGFTVARASIPNYCTMLELDKVGDTLDPHYLYALSVRPPCIAGAINGEAGPGTPRWFCMVAASEKQSFASVEEVRQLFRHSPQVLEMASAASIEAFAQRECHHVGQKLTCSQFYGGKAVLLGDAASPFTPIGQGVNAAMESAMTLDRCIGSIGHSPSQVLDAARRYSDLWKPEAEAVSWISEKMALDNPLHLLRGAVATQFGVSVFGQAKRSDIPYSQVKRDAERLWPLWA